MILIYGIFKKFSMHPSKWTQNSAFAFCACKAVSCEIGFKIPKLKVLHEAEIHSDTMLH